MRRRVRVAECAVVGLLLLVGTACGSRLPESDFEDRPGRTPTQNTAEPLRVGIITSATSPVGGNTFTGPRDGAKAYFDRLNARGGIDGRRVEVRTCDDGGSGVGNNECVHKLVDEDKVVALVATSALDYAGASRVSRARVPDIGGQPIGAAYDTYPHLYGIYGSLAPRGRKARLGRQAVRRHRDLPLLQARAGRPYGGRRLVQPVRVGRVRPARHPGPEGRGLQGGHRAGRLRAAQLPCRCRRPEGTGRRRGLRRHRHATATPSCARRWTTSAPTSSPRSPTCRTGRPRSARTTRTRRAAATPCGRRVRAATTTTRPRPRTTRPYGSSGTARRT